jgi:hypothetical protein
MKKLLIILSSFLLTACIFQTASKDTILKAEHVCKEHKGIKLIVIYSTGSITVHCMDDSRIGLIDIKLPEAINE